MSAPRIVLASTSRYRAQLLHRVLDDFEQIAPEVDEAARVGETPPARAKRLAGAKAAAVAARVATDAVIIGSDQVAALGQNVLHKPRTTEIAHQQLRASSGKTVDFFTGLCVIDGLNHRQRIHLDHTRVVFRALTAAEIAHYIERDQPLDCAGSFKSEGAGSVLFERLETEDPTALIGLPLIALGRLLREAGVAIP